MTDIDDERLTLIQDCVHRESLLSEWEVNFIDSISNLLEGGGSLSPKQDGVLNKLWDRVTENG